MEVDERLSTLAGYEEWQFCSTDNCNDNSLVIPAVDVKVETSEFDNLVILDETTLRPDGAHNLRATLPMLIAVPATNFLYWYFNEVTY